MYPKEIMRNTYWTFRGERFSDMNTFIKIVLEYHRDLEKEWDPSEIVFNNKGMTVQYSHWDEIEEDFENNKIIGYQGKGTGRPIYQVTHNGKIYNTAITVGDNGFIVGANPSSVP